MIPASETWLNDLSANQVKIPGYLFISNHRSGKTGGGTGLYLQNSLEYKIRSDCNYSDPDVEICVPRGKNIIEGSLYRPPCCNVAAFLEKFTEIVTVISRSDKYCYLAGDFNLDLLRYADHEPTREFVDCLFFHMFLPLISRPTCITAYSATLIDNIHKSR